MGACCTKESCFSDQSSNFRRESESSTIDVGILPAHKRISRLESLRHFFTNDWDVVLEDKYICTEKIIGQGGFSIVYEGMFIDSDIKVAIKKIHKSKAIDTTRLRLEVKILRSLHHPHVLYLYDFFEESLNYTLVTEMLMGGDVATRLSSKNNYNEKDARDLFVSLIKTVQFIHQQDIVHRDLKLDNILLKSLNNDYDIKLCDFGLATYCYFSTLSEPVGTFHYVAPEVLLGRKYGKRVDIWSVGVILYVLLIGELPFNDTNTNKDVSCRNIWKQICTGSYREFESNDTSISQDAKDLIQKILIVNTIERYTLDQILSHPWCSADGEILSRRSLDRSRHSLRNCLSKQSSIQVNHFQSSVKDIVAYERSQSSKTKSIKDIDVDQDDGHSSK